MKVQDIAFLLLSGLFLWLIGTFYYARHATAIFGTTSLRYWMNFCASPILTAAICIAILKARHVPPTAWASAVLLLALPGMIGETIILSHLPTLMPRLQTTSPTLSCSPSPKSSHYKRLRSLCRYLSK